MFKKLFTTLAIIALTFSGQAPALASLSSYWAERGDKFIPCNQERHELAAQYAVYDYDCSEEKNNLLERRLRDDETRVGASVATGYKSTLDISMTSSQTTVSPSSLALPDGVVLTMDILENEIFLVIEPGGSRQEIVRCTAISNGDFSSCARGLAFSGKSFTSVAANQFVHRAGSAVVMSNVHYVYENFLDKDSNETASGTKRFADNELIFGNGTTTGKKKLYFCDSASTSTCAYIYASPSSTAAGSLDFGFSPDGTSEFGLNSSGTVLGPSSTLGIEITNGLIGINRNSSGGLGFNGSGQLQITPSSTTGVGTDSNGLYNNLNPSSIGVNSGNQLTVVSSTIGSQGKVPVGTVSSTLDGSWILGTLIGYGGDGAVTVTTGNTTTLSRDMYYDSLTVNAGGAIVTAGYRIFVRGALVNNGQIVWPGNNGGNGGNASGATGGSAGAAASALTSASLFGNTTTIAGGTGAGGLNNTPNSNGTAGGGNAGTNQTACLGTAGNAGAAGGTGGAGGGFSGGTSTGGAAGSVVTSLIKPYFAPWAALMHEMSGTTIDYLKGQGTDGGSGGGGSGACGGVGAGQTSGGGGGGGAPGGHGGTIVVVANSISGSGVFRANGGDGGNGGNGGNSSISGCGCGGGGAGGNGGIGGTIVLIYGSSTFTGTLNVAAGSPGTFGTGGSGTCTNPGTNGTAGSAGRAGLTYLLDL